MKNKAKLLLAVCGLSIALAACSSPEEKVEKYYNSGIEFLEEGDLGRANVQFQNVLKIDEEHVPTLMGLTKIAEERKDFQAMFGTLQKVVRLDPENIEALAQLGKMYLLNGDETNALDFAERALALDVNYVEARTLKAGVMMRVGDVEAATTLAEGVLADDPGNAEATSILAAAKVKARDFDGAIAQLDSALSINPKRAVLQLMRINILEREGRHADAMDGLKNLIELFPENPVYRRTYASVLIDDEEYAAALEQLEVVADLKPDDLEAKLDVVRIINTMSGKEASEKRLKAFVEENPGDAEITFALVSFLIQKGDVDGAVKTLEPVMQSPEESVSLGAKNRLAAIYLREGRRDEAKTLVTEILASDEGNVDALTSLAQMEITDGHVENAIADLRTALNNDPDSYKSMIVLATAYQKQGNADAARAEYAKAFQASKQDSSVANIFARFLLTEKNPERAVEVLEQSISAHGDNIESLELLARARLEMQDWRGAEEVADILARAGDDMADQSVLNIRSIALSGLKEYDEVIDLLSNSDENTPLGASPLALLVNAYVSSGRFDGAKKMLEGVLASDSDNYPARLLLARTRFAAGESESARQTLRDAIASAPERTEAYISLYRNYVRNNERDAAAAIIDEALANAPESKALKIYKADMLLSQGDKAGALALYDELIDSFGQNSVVVNNYISLTTELRPDSSSAREALTHVDVIKDIDNPNIKDTIGWAYYRAGDLSAAVAYLRDAAEGAPENAEILYHFGAALVAAGEQEAGVKALEKALAAGGADFAFADEAKELIGR